MALDQALRAAMSLPAVCAPMFLVSGPELVAEACKAGLMGGLPRQNARSFEEFEAWLGTIRQALNEHEQATGRPAGPLAVNLATRVPEEQLGQHFEACGRHGVKVLITVGGDPTALIGHAHDAGLLVFHDITSIRFAEKAIAAGADGLNCIGAGGGGHSGTTSHLALIRAVRAIYQGTIVMGGAVSDGATIRAGEILGADLAYLGTRFIATRESRAPQAYKDLLVSQTSADLRYTDGIAGVHANWLVESIKSVGLDPENLPRPLGRGMRHDHLPEGAAPWKNIWSAGQGIDLIHDIPSVAELVQRLRDEYREACRLPAFDIR
ncbi:nitronate monooxygenase family protein [Hydrogenophaga sp. IBVHS1]|uniref:NAD(P)H-dependent flavin oxidoreductase n=1 Tax=unclassified Hydrogenophaga TaxID=2610897 RepID=UPI000A2D20DF|nr:nitronate monooxygenase [Hydrogenophaga sp. IBVHS1]OSZ75496.1 2-nitropropane dioxygenase [Hydrogenophaga sp. IBVHS1]